MLLLARQRAGTNALQAILGTHPQIHCTREVFHDEPEGQHHLEAATNFFRFLDRRGGPPSRRTREAQERLFLDYLASLRASTDKRFLVIDVKLNSTHHFDGPWRPLIGRPELFVLANRHRLRILHLVRANGLRTQVSHIKARETQHWVYHGNAPIEDFPVTVPTDTLLAALRTARAEDELVAGTFGGGRRYRRVEYAELFGDVRTGFAGIAEWLGVEPEFTFDGVQVHKQASLPLPETIENFAEVQHTLRGSPFESCLEDERLA